MATKKTSPKKAAKKKAPAKKVKAVKPVKKQTKSVKPSKKSPTKVSKVVKPEAKKVEKATPKSEAVKAVREPYKEKEIKLKGKLPTANELLEAGAQFGHKSKRFNPKMSDYIHSKRWDIHIIDVNKTIENLEKAVKFLTKAAFEGNVLFVGTKRQGQDIVESEAKRAGAFFIVNRWPGGLLTNFGLIKRSLKRLLEIEALFDGGVENMTKYEISRMKAEWDRLNRLYSGIKTMEQLPTAVVILDSNYEKVALNEARRLSIPVVSILDTNSDPELVNYPVPGNDDALASIGLFMRVFANSVLEGNAGKGVKHETKNYNVTEVKIKRKNDGEGEVEGESAEEKSDKMEEEKIVETEEKKEEIIA